MRILYPKRTLQIFLSIIFLFSFGAVRAISQSTNSQPKAVERNDAAPSGSQADTPSVPGAQTRILKDGEKIPERKNLEYEDWSRPELTPGMQTEIVALGKSSGNGFTRELLSVQWREMDPINLWIVKPTNVKNPPVILYLYSYDANNERYKDADFCKFLTRDGVAAVGFVSALTEQRFHDRPPIQTFITELQESLGATVHDVQLILNYLAERKDFDMNRVGMWGDGSGASIAIMAAAVDSRIKTLDLLDPWGDWPDWLAKSSIVSEKDRAEYLSSGFLENLKNLEPVTFLPWLSDRKVRLQYINGLSVTPATVREKLESAAPPNTEIVHYENTRSFIADVASKGKGFDWIRESVARPSPAEEAHKTSLESKNSRAQ